MSEMGLFETWREAVMLQRNDSLVPQGAVLMASDSSPGPCLEFGRARNGGERMTAEGSHYEYYQLRAMLEWDLSERATDIERRDRHRFEAEKYQILAKNAKRGMIKSEMD